VRGGEGRGLALRTSLVDTVLLMEKRSVRMRPEGQARRVLIGRCSAVLQASLH
jgi:hypothetical protein